MKPLKFGLDKLCQVPDILQFPDFRGRKTYAIGAFDREHKPDIAETVPAGHVFRRKGRAGLQRVVAKDISENLRQLGVDFVDCRFQELPSV